MPSRDSKHPRRIFDREIAHAIARWEILRRTRAYRDTVDAWLKPGGDGHLADGVVAIDAWDRDVSGRYDADCARFGLRFLWHPDAEFTEDTMAGYPVFRDTPSRQRRPKHVITGERAQQAPPDQQAALKALGDQQKRAYQAKVQGHPDWSQRVRQRHFGGVRVPPGPWQLPGRWAHLDNLRWYLRVLDLRRGSLPFSRIAEQLGISVDQAKRAWGVARRLVDAGLEPGWAPIETHLATCKRCRWSQEDTVPDRWCPEGRWLARSAALLMPNRRESPGRKRDAATRTVVPAVDSDQPAEGSPAD